MLLVGFMGSGKSAVGRRLSRMLGWRFLDMDAELEGEVGQSAAELLRELGEPEFRRLEHRTARRLLGEDRAVVASGGGWPCAPGRMEELGPGTLSVWLMVSAEASLERLGRSRTPRPLLEVDDPLARARSLLSEREPFYRMAHWHVRTDGRTSASVARDLRGRLDKQQRGL